MTPARLSGTVAVWSLFSLALWASDAEPAIAVLGGVIAAIAAVGFVAYDLARATAHVAWTKGQAPSVAAPRRSRFRTVLDRGGRRDTTPLADTLVTLVDDRLLANHGIDRAADPAAAAPLLSPRLRQLTEGGQRPMISPRDIRRALSDIEAL